MAKGASLHGKSLQVLGPKNRLRLACRWVVSLKYFDSIILLFIVVSTVLLSLENPLDDPSGFKGEILFRADIVMTTVFTLECLLKIIERGLILNGKKSYLRDSWNVIDFFIVISALTSISTSSIDLGFFKALRMIRVLRPLRMISRNEGLKIAVLSLLNSIPSLINAMIISLLFLTLFGILGTNFFKGQFFTCHDLPESPEGLESTAEHKWACLDNGGSWVIRDGHFDHVFRSILELFIMTTTEGWTMTMWAGVDATKLDYSPIRDYNPASIMFFTFFTVVGSLFVLNLFVGIVIGTFNKETERLGKNYLLTKV